MLIDGDIKFCYIMLHMLILWVYICLVDLAVNSRSTYYIYLSRNTQTSGNRKHQKGKKWHVWKLDTLLIVALETSQTLNAEVKHGTNKRLRRLLAAHVLIRAFYTNKRVNSCPKESKQTHNDTRECKVTNSKDLQTKILNICLNTALHPHLNHHVG